jgi:hypothetical protein
MYGVSHANVIEYFKAPGSSGRVTFLSIFESYMVNIQYLGKYFLIPF